MPAIQPATADTRTCPRCGNANGCAIAAGHDPEHCWCMTASLRAPLPVGAATCYCPDCLRQRAAETTTREA